MGKSDQARCRHDASNSREFLFESNGSEMLALSFAGLFFFSLHCEAQDIVANTVQFLPCEQKKRHLEINYRIQNGEDNFA